MLSASIANDTIKYFLPVSLMIIGGIVFILCSLYFFRITRQQYKLHNSITLVELKQPKLFFIIVTGVITGLLVYTMVLAISPSASVVEMLTRVYRLDILLIKLVFIGLTILLAAVELLMIQMIFARAAIVDRGVYIGNAFIDWHHIYDYYVDEIKNSVILSTNKKGPLTLSGTTEILRFDADDIEKIKFILNKNKNKFIPRYELR